MIKKSKTGWCFQVRERLHREKDFQKDLKLLYKLWDLIISKDFFDKPKNKDHVSWLSCPMEKREENMKNLYREGSAFFQLPGPLYRDKGIHDDSLRSVLRFQILQGGGGGDFSKSQGLTEDQSPYEEDLGIFPSRRAFVEGGRRRCFAFLSPCAYIGRPWSRVFI